MLASISTLSSSIPGGLTVFILTRSLVRETAGEIGMGTPINEIEKELR
jgi:hypothetical protein